MASSIVKISYTGEWKALASALDPKKQQKIFEKHVGRATALNAKLAQRAIRKKIREAVPPPNQALTVAIKKSTKPLVDRGDLFQAIATTQQSWKLAFAGVKASDEAYNIGKALHDGVAIIVTPKMRNLFFLLWRASVGSLNPSLLTGRAAELWARKPGGWHKLSPGKSLIIIPERPFVKLAMEDATLQATCVENWKKAVESAWEEIKQKGG